jgi:hypothetical protein
MTGITTKISILTLNVNGLNSLIKRHHLADGLKKKIQQCCLEKNNLVDRNKHWLMVKAWKRFTKPMAPQNRQE